MIEGSVVGKRNDGSYVIDGGEVRELPQFPRQSGYLQKPMPELGLTEESYLWTDSDFSYDEGLRPVVRGVGWVALKRRFVADAYRRPSVSYSGLGFRPARRGLVRTGNEIDFVRVP